MPRGREQRHQGGHERPAVVVRLGDAPQQRWKLLLVDVAKELYELRPTHVEDRCLDIAGGSLKEGANAQQWGCNGTPAQRWRVKPVAA
ncbi:hypothetical protein EKH77_28055 [Streptomyces luteoverticillatus]|uniref:Ricin B lectin domain-containing protein n=1 Tax=Streptomyces luteoverticillatus TaxID=66425 RepID=A0A3S9PQ59_STRLT|nr:hypothetical protein EKH77_28055 [Streptomyces luteoverticillatus]